MSNNKWTYSKEQFEKATIKAWKKLLNDFPSAVPSKTNPTAFFLGGQPGAGKSTSQDMIIKEYLNNNALPISIDDFRKYHPHFKEIYDTYGANSAIYTHEFASDIARNIRQKCIEQKYSVIVVKKFNSFKPQKSYNRLKPIKGDTMATPYNEINSLKSDNVRVIRDGQCYYNSASCDTSYSCSKSGNNYNCGCFNIDIDNNRINARC
ncbi:MAG: zeta toxin family protein [Campylobacteraceae bacterium]|jgi:hypothetical protein|nr:zeta toxin family protein [Campylobacteraceae bacterium]